MMNKEEAIEEIKTCKSEYDGNSRDVWCYEKGFEDARSSALNSINKLDEPEKPVLTKEEAEWVDKLTNSNNLSDSLYYITRCGFRYPFVFVDNGKVYKLSIELKDIKNYDDLCKIKDRLIKAVIYGYEVEKEKLYTVELPNPNDAGHVVLYKDKNGKITIEWDCAEDWKRFEGVKLTESEIKKDFAWTWQFAEEVNDND